jgi:hypothetical protein
MGWQGLYSHTQAGFSRMLGYFGATMKQLAAA